MRITRSPVIFNPETWGLANDQLPEIDPVAQEAGMVAGKV
jgi:DNA-directed RNA polymerase subunit H (RpoH/RPB5)